MNRDFILNLSLGKELNDLVAKEIMGREGDWSESMKSAWEVVEKLQATYWLRMNSMMGEHFCGVGKPDLLWEYRCKSMPESICKAALIAVIEGKVEES